MRGLWERPLLHVEIDGRAVPYVLRWSTRRRTIGLQVGPDGLTVAAPVGVPPEVISRTLKDRGAWILNHLGRHPSGTLGRAWRPAEGSHFYIRGEPMTLAVTQDQLRVRSSVTSHDGRLTVVVGRHTPSSDDALRETIRMWAVRQAREVLTPRVRVHADALGARLTMVRIADQRRRWGSCDHRGVVRLNWRLIQLPDDLSDYVAAHEAAHLHEMNHGPRFWALVEGIMPDWRSRRARLRSESGRYVMP